jgi:hypothetical protein
VKKAEGLTKRFVFLLICIQARFCAGYFFLKDIKNEDMIFCQGKERNVMLWYNKNSILPLPLIQQCGFAMN